MKDTISKITYSAVEAVNDQTYHCDTYLYIAIIEFIIIIILLLIIFNRRNKVVIDINNTDDERVDMNSNMLNIGKKLNGETQIIYDKLRKACHPDRFPNDEHKIAIATHLISKVNQSKDKFSDLEALKIEIEKQLNVKIN